MPEHYRSQVFNGITNDDYNDKFMENDYETALNLLCFYNKLDNDEFAGHENDWVLIHKQIVKGFWPAELKGDEANEIDNMLGAIQLPVDQTCLSKPVKMKKVVIQYGE